MRELLLKSLLSLAAIAAVAAPANAQIRVDSRMYTNSGSCARCDLSGRTLTGMTLRDSNFAGAQFNRSNLSGGNFDRSNLSDTQFKRAFLARVEGQSVNMANASFQDATMTEAKFDDAILDGAKFYNVEFGNAVLIGATMDGADFSKADLSEVQGLQQAQLDMACGDSETRLPIGLSLSYCENMTQGTHDDIDHAALSPKMARAAKRLDIAISNVEALLSDSETVDPTLRRRLQRIHSDLMSSRRAIEN